MVQEVLTTTDFNNILTNYAGRQLVHIPITKSVSNRSGDETLTESTPVSITAYFMRTDQTIQFADKQGDLDNSDAVALTKYSDGVQHNDILAADGTVLSISSIDGDATTITVDTSTVHGLSAGEEVLILGTTNYDGLYTVATTPDTDTFTISDTNHDLAAETSGEVQKDFTKFRVDNAFNVPGTYDDSGGSTTFVYTRCNLFLI